MHWYKNKVVFVFKRVQLFLYGTNIADSVSVIDIMT